VALVVLLMVVLSLVLLLVVLREALWQWVPSEDEGQWGKILTVGQQRRSSL